VRALRARHALPARPRDAKKVVNRAAQLLRRAQHPAARSSSAHTRGAPPPAHALATLL
jgi:hypothetical protein